VVPTQFRSTAVGIYNTCGSAAGGVGVLLAGLFKQELGLNLIFGAASGLDFRRPGAARGSPVLAQAGHGARRPPRTPVA